MNSKTVSHEDLALFAMQLLTPEENAEVLAHLEENVDARSELARIQGDLAVYALTSDLHSPPAFARERLMRSVSKEKKLVPVVRTSTRALSAAAADSAVSADEPLLLPRTGRLYQMGQEPASRRPLGGLMWAGWAVAAGLSVVAGLQFRQRQLLQDSYASQSARLASATIEAARAEQVMKTLTSEGAVEVALHLTGGTAEPPKPEGHAAYVAETGSLVFVGMHLNPLQANKTYELWLIPDHQNPVPAGLFKPDQRGFASVMLPELPKGILAQKIGVSIENEGGSTQGPTDVVLIGA